MRYSFLFWASALLVPILALSASTSFMSGSHITMGSNSPVRITVEFPFTEGPAYGHVPFVVSINNTIGQAGTWNVTARVSNGYYQYEKSVESHFRLAAPDGQQQIHISAPITRMTGVSSGHSPTSLNLSFDGPYTVQYSTHYRSLSDNSYSSRQDAILLSPSLGRQYSPRVRSLYRQSSPEPIIATYKESILPEDWRCYVGFDMILMAQDDWLGLAKGKRNAILDAVASGEVQLRFSLKPGVLTFELAKQMGIPSDASVWDHGLGRIACYNTPFKDALEKASKNRRAQRETIFDSKLPQLPPEERSDQVTRLQASDEATYSLDQLIHKNPPSGSLITIAIIVFGVLVGPVNLFVLAKGRKRLRIFITTPILAGITSLILFLAILLVDGIGGEGYIARAVFLKPNGSEVYVRQEQVSSTGLFFGDAFEVEGEELLFFRGATLSSGHSSQDRGAFSYMDGQHGGDWFASKRLQSQGVQTYVPSRESIEFIQQSEGAPELFSNFRAVCSEIYYVDMEGAVWRGSDLRLGGKQVLEPSEYADLKRWYAKQCYQAGQKLGDELGRFGIRKGHFYASIKDWQQSGLNTIEGIDWKVNTQLLIGQPNVTLNGGVAR